MIIPMGVYGMSESNAKIWYLERILFLIGGSVSLLGLLIAYFISPWGLVLNILASINMILFSLVGFCPMAFILTRLGVPRKCEAIR